MKPSDYADCRKIMILVIRNTSSVTINAILKKKKKKRNTDRISHRISAEFDQQIRSNKNSLKKSNKILLDKMKF